MVEDMSDFEEKYRGWHARISFFKSSFRIAACLGTLVAGADAIYVLAFGLLLAEILGIVEEIM
jgi:hypothetical protein